MAVFDLPEIDLPAYARFYNFIETKKSFNSNYDIVWSFQYKLPSTSLSGSAWPKTQAGFTTFLTTLTSPTSSLPGQYLGDSDSSLLSGVELFTQSSNVVFTEGSTAILVSQAALSGNIVKIAFDTTGLYALSGRNNRTGVSYYNTHPQAFIIRDFNNNVVCNVPLSTMNTTFSSLSTDEFRTLRFRYANIGRKLHIDFRESTTTTFTPLTTFNLGYSIGNFDDLDNVYCGFSYCTPISDGGGPGVGGEALSAGPFFLKDFHIEGFQGGTVLTETLTSEPLSSNPNTNTTTVTQITAQ
tara:strand:- start:1155 stop:2045 length:891 start_codon:yes stop_codon:yes gene_type:complete